MQEFLIKWNHVNDLMPEHHKYVLVETPYCKYFFATAYWSSVAWISADDRTEILNVEYWTEIRLPR